MWIYKSPFGVMRIVRSRGHYDLFLCDECVNSYLDPDSAADDVFTQHSGFDDFDNADIPDIPSCIDEWQYLPDPR